MKCNQKSQIEDFYKLLLYFMLKVLDLGPKNMYDG